MKEKASKPDNKKKLLSQRQKEILFGIGTFAGSFIITTVIILTFAVFIPQGKVNEQKKQYSTAVSLLDKGNYAEAASYFKTMSYDDSRNLFHVAQAGKYFEIGDYESGIQSIHNAGGSVDVYYDPNGGTVSNRREVLKIKKKWVENKPTWDGYDFINWNISSFDLSYSSKNYTANLHLLASWNIINYTITYNLNGGSLSNLPNDYNTETPTFKLGSPTKRGYTFTGWSGTDINGTSMNVSIEKGSIGNRSYVANYEANQYVVTYDYGYDELSENQTVTFDSSYSLPEPSREGFHFDGWYYNNQVVTSGQWIIDSNATFVAHWSILLYDINYILNGGVNDPDNQSTYSYFDEITIKDPTKTGYQFDGWYVNNEKFDGVINKGSTGNIDLEARWIPHKNELTVASEDSNLGTTSIVSGSGYTGETIVVKAEPAEGYIFLGWDDGSSIISNESTYTFEMPANDYSLTAHFIDSEYTELGVIPTLNHKVITYGLYPRTHVNNRNLMLQLETNGIVSATTGWTLYNNKYYCKASPTFNGGYFDDQTEFMVGADYWFECEVIEWDVLSFDEHGAYVVSKEILDTSPFKGDYASSIKYQANYEESDVRKWLNETFYTSAFALSSAYIRTVEVDNSLFTTDGVMNSNCCNNTFDNVFLGSYKDFYSMGPNSDRMCWLTDYARVRGDIYWQQTMDYQYKEGEEGTVDRSFAPYLTRSPVTSDVQNHSLWCVVEDGSLQTTNTNVTMGIRPCVYISLDHI